MKGIGASAKGRFRLDRILGQAQAISCGHRNTGFFAGRSSHPLGAAQDKRGESGRGQCGLSRVIVGPLIMCCDHFGGFGFRHQLDGCA